MAKEWNSTGFSTADVSTQTTTILGTLAFLIPGTILRMRGVVQAAFDETVQVGDRMLVTWGLGIVSTDAATLGATAMPDPDDEPEFPWLWWGAMELRSNLTAGANAWGLQAQRLEVDSKAMRRFKPGQSLVWVAQTFGDVGAPVTHLTTLRTRVLLGT